MFILVWKWIINMKKFKKSENFKVRRSVKSDYDKVWLACALAHLSSRYSQKVYMKSIKRLDSLVKVSGIKRNWQKKSASFHQFVPLNFLHQSSISTLQIKKEKNAKKKRKKNYQHYWWQSTRLPNCYIKIIIYENPQVDLILCTIAITLSRVFLKIPNCILIIASTSNVTRSWIKKTFTILRLRIFLIRIFLL